MAGSTFNPRPATIEAVVDYILKKLGVQLLEINITEEQLLDRISDAIVYFQENHVDGSFRSYIKTVIQPSVLVFPATTSTHAVIGESITGPNDFSAKILSISTDKKTLGLYNVCGTLAAGAIITFADTTTQAITSLTLGPADNGGYLESPANVESVVQILQVPTVGTTASASDMLDSSFSLNYAPYSTFLNQFFQYGGGKLSLTYGLQQMRQDTQEWLRALTPWMNFNRYRNKIFLENYDFLSNIGNWLIIEVMCSTDPEVYPEMYGDTWFLRYATELVRRQWGENLSKFEEVALLNGVKVNGTKMIDSAEKQIEKLEQELWEKYREPDDFFLA